MADLVLEIADRLLVLNGMTLEDLDSAVVADPLGLVALVGLMACGAAGIGHPPRMACQWAEDAESAAPGVTAALLRR